MAPFQYPVREDVIDRQATQMWDLYSAESSPVSPLHHILYYIIDIYNIFMKRFPTALN